MASTEANYRHMNYVHLCIMKWTEAELFHRADGTDTTDLACDSYLLIVCKRT